VSKTMTLGFVEELVRKANADLTERKGFSNVNLLDPIKAEPLPKCQLPLDWLPRDIVYRATESMARPMLGVYTIVYPA